MGHPNEDLLRRGYAAFAAGDLETVMSIFSDDIAWHENGANSLAGDYKGHAEVMGFFAKLMEVTEGSFRLEVHDVLANDKHGVVLVEAHAKRSGKSYDGRSAHVWHIADGKATEFWGLDEDEAALDAFLA